MRSGDRVTVRCPSSARNGAEGTLIEDAGLAERGPDRGSRFWWVLVPGTVYPIPLMFHEGELLPQRKGA